MSKAAPAMVRQAVDLLFNVIETPNATIAAAVLYDYYKNPADQLISANLIEHCGNQLATTSMADHDDAPVTRAARSSA